MATMPLALNCAVKRIRTWKKIQEKITDFERGPDLVGKWCPPDALTTFASSRWVPGLNYETSDITVKYASIEVP